MESATIRDVQHNLAAYLRRVEQGEDIEIRRRNKVVARLVHVDLYQGGGKPDWSVVRERREALWGRKAAPGKAASSLVYESRGDR
jgi:prevent-host-death family protein